MLGRAFITRLGATNTSNGRGVDITGFHRASVDVEVRNMREAIYAYPTSVAHQTYYNKISVRALNVADLISLNTQNFEIVNGNIFDYVSGANIANGILLQAFGSVAGPSSNTFNIAYIEQFTSSGIKMIGDSRYNTFVGGMLENGAGNDIVSIQLSGGATRNKFFINVAPVSTAKVLQAIGCTNNDFHLGVYGTYVNWSTDIGPNETVKTRGTNAGFNIGGVTTYATRKFLLHDFGVAGTTGIINVATGEQFVVTAGTGTVTGIDATSLVGTNEITIACNGTVTLQHNAAGVMNNFRLKGAINVTPPNNGMVTFIRSDTYSANWYEKSRSF